MDSKFGLVYCTIERANAKSLSFLGGSIIDVGFGREKFNDGLNFERVHSIPMLDMTNPNKNHVVTK